MAKIRYILTIIFIGTINLCFSQKTTILTNAIKNDSSYYHIAKINENEFWAGGEYGVLNKIDSNGDITPILYSNNGNNILNITNTQNKIIICKDKGEIISYDKSTQVFTSKQYKKYSNSCFYDLVKVKNRFYISGGASGIAKAEKKIPNGFIIELDEDLNIKDKVWSSFRKFPWSIAEKDGKIYASIFNGQSSKIIGFEESKKTSKSKVKALVHEIKFINNDLWYSGSKSIRFQEDGVIGSMNKDFEVLKGTGCIWSIKEYNNKIYGCSNKGDLIEIDTNTNIINPNYKNIFYDIEQISSNQLLLVGHDKTAIIQEL